MSRFYYANSVPNFLLDSPESILGTLTQNSQFDVTDLQRNTWIQEIQLLTRPVREWSSLCPRGIRKMKRANRNGTIRFTRA
ncbi:MAG: hypothetical protein K6C40_10460 [Thermoguttaceae bacterium]|nr:hypothetical protein [Thermoguttaceae bacterium]